MNKNSKVNVVVFLEGMPIDTTKVSPFSYDIAASFITK